MSAADPSRPDPNQQVLEQDWPLEDAQVLASAWFSGSENALMEMARSVGQEFGVVARLSFLKNLDQENHERETVVMLSIDGDQHAPFLVGLDLRWAGQFQIADIYAAIRKRLVALIKGRASLKLRYERMRRAAVSIAEKAGNGAKVSRLVLKPVDLFEEDFNQRKRGYCVDIDLLDDDLVTRPMKQVIYHSRELRKYTKLFVRVQKARAATLKRRLANPGKIEIEDIALYLLRLCDLEASQVVAVPVGFVAPGPDSLIVNGARLTRTVFSVGGGIIRTQFRFEGGYYDSGSLILHDALPESIQQSLPGMQLRQIISGGIFDIIDQKIARVGEMSGGTMLRLKSITQMVDCPNLSIK